MTKLAKEDVVSHIPHYQELAKKITLNENDKFANLDFFFAGDLVPPIAFSKSSSSSFISDKIKAEINECDFSIVNLECPLTDRDNPIRKDGPHLRADPECASTIRSVGFDTVGLANNHILDMGEKGLKDTIKNCEAAGLNVLGAGLNLAEAQEPIIYESKDIKVAVIAFAEHEFSIASKKTAGCAPLDPIQNFYQVQRAREKADVVIVSLHGGLEYESMPRPGLVEHCRFLVECGASTVVCHHTHVPSAIEVYRDCPIVYGLGNFLFERSDKPNEWFLGYGIKLSISKDGITSFKVIPFRQKNGYIDNNEDVKREVLRMIYEASVPLKDEDKLKEEWKKICKKKKEKYLINLRSPVIFRGIERLIKTFPFLKRILLPNRLKPSVLNLIRCESHREALLTIIEMEDKENA